jgi:hypothetical protein
MQLAGGVVVQMATNTAAAVKAAQGALDDAVPGPSVQRVLINLRCGLGGKCCANCRCTALCLLCAELCPPPLHTPTSRPPIPRCRNTTEGILSDAQAALGRVMPTPEIQEMDALMRATVQSVLALMEDSANEVTDGPGVLVRRRRGNPARARSCHDCRLSSLGSACTRTPRGRA